MLPSLTDIVNALQSIALAIANPKSFKGAVVMRSTVQSIASSTFTVMAFDVEQYDYGNFHSTTTNTSRLVAPVDGIYRIAYTAGINSAAGGSERSFWVAVNGNGGAGAQRYAVSTFPPGAQNTRNGSCELQLAANDYVELWVYQDSGGALNTTADTTANPGAMRFSMHLINN